MTKELSRIRSVINSELPTDSAVFTRLNGLGIPIDPFLTGKLRFARKLGDVISHCFPDNTTSLVSEGVIGNQQKVFTSENIPWIVPGSLLLIDAEICKVTVVQLLPFTTSPKTSMLLTLETPFKAGHSIGATIVLWGHPLEVTGIQDFQVSETFTSAQILIDDGTYTGVNNRRYVRLASVPVEVTQTINDTNGKPIKFVQGLLSDIIAFGVPPVNGVIVSYEVEQKLAVNSNLPIYDLDKLCIGRSEYAVEKAEFAGFADDPSNQLINDDLILKYNITLKRGVYLPPKRSARYPAVGSTIYLRCNPAYESKNLTIPTFPFSNNKSLGPFCLDWFSGSTVENFDPQEACLLSIQDVNNIDIFKSQIEKNYPIYSTPIGSDAILFWDRLRGTVNWNGSEVITLPDNHPDLQVFQMHWKAIPKLQVSLGVVTETFASNQVLTDVTGLVTGTIGLKYVQTSKQIFSVEQVIQIVDNHATNGTLPKGKGSQIVGLPIVLAGTGVTVTYKYPLQVTNLRLKVRNTNPTQDIRVTLQANPNPPVSTIVLASTVQIISLSIPLDALEVDRIFLSYYPVTKNLDDAGFITGGSITEPVYFGQWYTDYPSLSTLKYVIVNDAIYRYRFGFSGLFLKTLFLSTEYIKNQLDYTAAANNGKLLLP